MARKVLLPLAILFIMSFRGVETDRWITGTIVDDSDGTYLPGVNILLKGTTEGAVSDMNGIYRIKVPDTGGILVYSFIGYISQEVKISNTALINVRLQADVQELSEVVVTGYAADRVKQSLSGSVAGVTVKSRGKHSKYESAPAMYGLQAPVPANTEDYQGIEENIFHNPTKKPLSTFSIDVDAASYANVRRFLNNGQLPPKDAVRIEEMVNYFNYHYADPEDRRPFAVHTELSEAPWNTKHRLVQIGVQGKHIATDKLPASNLVFLLDVSGSMSDANKLPLLKSAFKLLIQELREEDRVAIVVYAGAAGLVLPSTSGDNKAAIENAIDHLSSGGSTAGGAGIQLAYKIAKENFVKGGNNRVILATDGDFNVGESSNTSMEKLIESKRDDGIFLTVLGFGMGNYKDSKMEILADKGNGNYAYIDNITEARKVLVTEFGGTLFTIAKDVKIQIEFNPKYVAAYRLIGYENRKLNDEDFNNDKKDAGELGAGHTVTALYEIIPVGVESEFDSIDPLKYQRNKPIEKMAVNDSNEIMNIKLRYKNPNENTSQLIVHPLKDTHKTLSETSDNFRWAAAVANFGMLLRDSEFKGNSSYADVVKLAKGAKGEDEEGYRAEFINMVKSCLLLAVK